MGFFSMSGGRIGKNIIIFGADMTYSILILGEGPTQGLYPNSYLFVNGVEIIKFKAKASEINTTLLCLGNVPKRNVRW